MALYLPQTPSPLYSNLRVLSTAKFHTYQAYDNDHSQSVVLKIFPITATLNPKYQNEKNLLSNIEHPNIIKLLNSNDMSPTPTYFNDDLTSYLVLEHAVHGDLLDVVSKYGRMTEQLARKVFRQIIEGISYLHSHNIAHLDLKMENLLIGSDYSIKVADFDLSQPLDATELEGRGTSGSRAPEVRKGECQDFKAADVYSVGIILFSLVAGLAPYSEVETSFGPSYDKLYKFFRTSNERFWDMHKRYIGDVNLFSENFKKLVNQLLVEDPKMRPTVEDIKSSSWYQEGMMEEEVYKNEMKNYMRQ